MKLNRLSPPSCPRIARRNTRVNALMSRASTSFWPKMKTWIAGSSPAMTEERGASPAMAKQDERGVVVAAPLELVEARGRGKDRIRRLLDDGERAGSEPAARTRRGECPFGERAPIRR